jgi:enolase
LIAYYLDLLPEYPLITYLEDPFHENDVVWRNELFNKIGKGRLIVADDLTVSKVWNIQKYQEMFNACILKINQARSVSELINSYNYCKKHGIATIISQRSWETDSNILAHLAVGLGCDYFKAWAPARERIVKYNELLRIC